MTHDAHQTHQDALGPARFEGGGHPDASASYVFLEDRWEFLLGLAGERDGQKRGFASSRYWTDASHFVGLCGEDLVAFLIGQELDAALRIGGDRGRDFLGPDGRVWNVKASTFWDDPHLKLAPQERSEAKAFLLCALEARARRVRYVGWAMKELLEMAPLKDYGYGPRRSLPASMLHKCLPGHGFDGKKLWLWKCPKCWQPTYLYVKGTDICPECFS